MSEAASPDPREPKLPRWMIGRNALIALWIVAPLVALGIREHRHAAVVERILDERIDDLQREIAEGRMAAPRAGELEIEVGRLESEVVSVLPCEVDMAAIEAGLRSRLEPLGVQVRPHQRKRMKDFYDEHPIPITLPAREGVEAEVDAVIAASTPFTTWNFSEGPGPAMVVTFGYRCEDTSVAALPYHGDPIPARDLLIWPFDRGVETRELRIVALREERDRFAEALRLLMYRRRLVDDLARRKAIAEDLVKRAESARADRARAP